MSISHLKAQELLVGTSRRRRLGHGLLAAGAAGLLLLLGTATPAHAAGTPGAPYTGMGTCPLTSSTMQDTTNAQVGCVVSVTNSGSVTIAGTTLTLASPITLQFGVVWPKSKPVVKFPDKTSANVYDTVAPADGKELTADPLEVDIPGLPNLLPGVTSVYAQVEIAGPITNFVPLARGQSYPVFDLPIKIHLTNALFGSSCYLGSDGNPIVLHPTMGTTNPPPPATPLKGDPGTLALARDPHGHAAIIASFTGASLVDNTFTVPGATGCGLFGILDPIINSVFKLPSAAGNNAVVFSGTNTSLAVDPTITDLAAAIAASEQ